MERINSILEIISLDIWGLFGLYMKTISFIQSKVDPAGKKDWQSCFSLEGGLNISIEPRYEFCSVLVDLFKIGLAEKIGDIEEAAKILGEHYFLLPDCIERYRFMDSSKEALFKERIVQVQSYFKEIARNNKNAFMEIRPYILMEELHDCSYEKEGLSFNELREFKKKSFLINLEARKKFLFSFCKFFEEIKSSVLNEIQEQKENSTHNRERFQEMRKMLKTYESEKAKSRVAAVKLVEAIREWLKRECSYLGDENEWKFSYDFPILVSSCKECKALIGFFSEFFGGTNVFNKLSFVKTERRGFDRRFSFSFRDLKSFAGIE